MKNPPDNVSGKRHEWRAPTVDLWQVSRKLLAVADVQTGYHHDSISHALATLSLLGRRTRQFVTNIRTDSQLLTLQPLLGVGPKYGGKPVNARVLSEYDAVFLLPSGAGTLSAEQRADLFSYVHDKGRGLILGHAGAMAFFEWPEFYDLIGGRMGGEFTCEARIKVEDPAFPGADVFGGTSFSFYEQHPVFTAPYSRDKVNVVMSLDPESLSKKQRAMRPDDDFPVIWSRRFGTGRVFNIGWGHFEATWDDPRFQRLLLGGILWAMGA
ncbi:MAG: hypothetical protein KatS3mg111_2191 [Pirellulaceae bacterium]|nr:MAG: hypothetical protein KatS3mg111_2191 [Pirellulaceae bacterium]